VIGLVTRPGWPEAHWAWSVRPDLWPLGQSISVTVARADADLVCPYVATVGRTEARAVHLLALSQQAGWGAPGVGEGLILQGALHHVRWLT